MKKTVRATILLIVLLALLLEPNVALGFEPYKSYTYSTAMGYATAVYSPTPYLPEKYIDSATLKVNLSQPVDMCFDNDGLLYIVDYEKNRIVVLNEDYTVKTVITELKGDTPTRTLNHPSGLFITKDNMLYICDTDNKRVLLCDMNFTVIKEYVCPTSDLLGENYNFSPKKIAVDESGTMYIINNNETTGIMKINEGGSFISFMGSNKAIVNLADLFWRKFMTEEQTDKAVSFVAVEYKNLSMDNSGFLYTVSASTAETTPIKRLNLSGDDVLIKSGYVDITGDVAITDPDSVSVFSDIVSDENNNYYALDKTNSRIFVYNSDGYLLYTFGGEGEQIGAFSLCSAIEYKDGKILVLDELKASITVFNSTEYANLITEAESKYDNGYYEESIELYNQVLKLNSNFELAYAQIGKVELRQKNYESAMKYFKLGNFRGDKVTLITGYNKAFSEYRREWAQRYLWTIPIAAGLLIICSFLLKGYLKNRKRREKRNENA